jgi:hypothetical protein
MGAARGVARDLREYHPVMIALDKAQALTSVLEQLGETTPETSNNLINALRDGTHSEGTIDWLRLVVAESLRGALDEAEAAFRKSLTPEQMRAHVLGGPVGVA